LKPLEGRKVPKRTRSEIVKAIFEALIHGEKQREGIAIKDCRGKEIMVVTRYGGDIILSFFDVGSDVEKFTFVVEMTGNQKWYWTHILKRFVEIKAKLKGQ